MGCPDGWREFRHSSIRSRHIAATCEIVLSSLLLKHPPLARRSGARRHPNNDNKVNIAMLALLNDLIWSKLLIVMLIGLGLLFTIRSGFVQFRYFGKIGRPSCRERVSK